MKVFVLDANAVIRYLTKGVGEEKVTALLERASKGKARLLISVVNWGEALYTLARVVGLSQATADLKSMSALVDSVPVSEAQVEAAAVVRLRYKLGYADCFAASLALREHAQLVTADPDFAKLGKQLKILALPRHAQ